MTGTIPPAALQKSARRAWTAIGGALRELEGAGYIVRHQLRDRQGRISDTEYVIYEQPQLPETPGPDTAGARYGFTRYGKPVSG